MFGGILMEISAHCVERFMERAGWTHVDTVKASAKIQELLSKAIPVTIKKEYRVNRAFLRSYGSNEYLKISDWIFILDPIQNVVVTCYRSSGLKWSTV
jgi:hypothetical protein